MKIIQAYPPNIKEIREHFDIIGRSDVVFTYGDVLFNPGGGDIRKDLMVHEETHSKQQQKLGSEKWWKKYFEDPKFRLEMELEAYGNQLKTYRENNKRNLSKVMMYNIALAQDLSSSVYGNIIDLEKAKTLINIRSINLISKYI